MLFGVSVSRKVELGSAQFGQHRTFKVRPGKYVTTVEPFAEMVATNPSVQVVRLDNPECHVPRDRLDTLADIAGPVVFVDRVRGIGDMICNALALEAFAERNPRIEVHYGCTDNLAPFQPHLKRIKTHGVLVPAELIVGAAGVVFVDDLLPEDAAQTTKPFHQESVLAVSLGIGEAWRRGNVKPRKPGKQRIAIFPQSTAILRSLPISDLCDLISGIAKAAGSSPVEIDVHLTSDAYGEAWAASPAAGEIARGIGRARVRVHQMSFLVAQARSIASADLVLTMDSGPLHIAKLTGTRTLGLFTTVDSRVRIDGYANLDAVQLSYEGKRCQAPCGLGGLLSGADGTRGCYETIGDGVPAGPVQKDRAMRIDEQARLDSRGVPCHANLPAVVTQVVEWCRRQMAGDGD